MGFFKIIAFIAIPISSMTYAAFSLGKQLPKATRKMGNYIGLSYIYFKCILKVLKPEDQMSYQMIQIARKAQQQSQALRRQLKNTMKKVKEDFNKKHEQTFNSLSDKIKNEEIKLRVQKKNGNKVQNVISELRTGSQMMREMQIRRIQLIEKKKQKKESRKFFDQI